MNYKVADLCFSVEGCALSVLEDFQVDEEAQWHFNFVDGYEDKVKVHPYLTVEANQPVISGFEDQKIRGRIDSESKSIEMAKGPNATYLMRSALHWALEWDNAFLVHACGLSVDGCGVLVPGASGAGKSTVASRFSQAELLSEEIIAVKDGVLHKMPFREGQAEAQRCDVILFPVHDSTFSLRETTHEEAFIKMLPRVSMGAEDKDQVEAVMGSVADFLKNCLLFDMHFCLQDDLKKLLGETLWTHK